MLYYVKLKSCRKAYWRNRNKRQRGFQLNVGGKWKSQRKKEIFCIQTWAILGIKSSSTSLLYSNKIVNKQAKVIMLTPKKMLKCWPNKPSTVQYFLNVTTQSRLHTLFLGLPLPYPTIQDLRLRLHHRFFYRLLSKTLCYSLLFHCYHLGCCI